MKTFSLSRLIAAGALALAVLASPAFLSVAPADAAVAVVSQSRASMAPTVKLMAYGDVTAASTYATTSYADVTGSSFTFTPTLNDCTTAARVLNTGATRPCLIQIQWSLDVTKATTLTGTCAVYVNGAIVAASARTVDVAAKESTMGGLIVVPNTVVGTQTIKLQCKSADTAVLTVNFGHVAVWEIIPN